MKKIIFLLLFTVISYGQTLQNPTFGIVTEKSNSTDSTPAYFTTSQVDGVHKKTPAALIAKVATVNDSLATKENTANKVGNFNDVNNIVFPTTQAVVDLNNTTIDLLKLYTDSKVPANYSKVVYVNATSPNTATIFDDENPPVTNDNLLKNDAANLYIGNDASTWVYNGLTYVTKVVPPTSNFYIAGTTIDAGSDKISDIERNGDVNINGRVMATTVGVGHIEIGGVGNGRTITAFDLSGNISNLDVTQGFASPNAYINNLNGYGSSVSIALEPNQFRFYINFVEKMKLTETELTAPALKLTTTPTTSTGAFRYLTYNETTDAVESVVSLPITVRKISTNTTLSDSDNGKVILLTSSCTVTLPNGLMSGFNCSFATQAGATLTYSLGGSVVLINNVGTTMAEKLSHTIVNTGVSNEYLIAGAL